MNGLMFGSCFLTTSSGNNNNVPMDTNCLRVTTSNEFDVITGIERGLQNMPDQPLFILNHITSKTLIINHQDANSTAKNRFINPENSPIVLPAGRNIFFMYDNELERYVTFAPPSPFPVGFQTAGFYSSAPAGWVLMNGGTIGNASSAATLLASQTAIRLFIHLWDSLSDSEAAVSGGRGASALADFAANKTIVVPNHAGYGSLGKTPSGTGSTMGGKIGALDHTHQVVVPSESATVLLNLGQVGQNGTYTTDSANAPTISKTYIIKI